MSTLIKSELSKKSKYYIPKHRYFELKHFCMQYNLWKKHLEAIDLYQSGSIINLDKDIANSFRESSVERLAEERSKWNSKIELIEHIAQMTDNVIGNYILKGITEGISFSIIKVKYNIPCGKDVYYNLYRKFFWLLDKEKE